MVEKVNETTSTSGGGSGLTDEEAALYDRQIRLWGVEAQQRLRKAKILLVGLKGLGNEICKNILLAGIQHLTMLDDSVLTREDITLQFLAPQESVGVNRAEASYTRAKKLNPLVDIVVDTEDVNTKGEDYYKRFDVVCMTGYDVQLQKKVNSMCHKLGVKFLSGHTFGYYGYMFADLQQHTYMEEKVKVLKNECSNNNNGSGPSDAKKRKTDTTSDEVEYEEKRTDFCTLEDALSVQMFEGKSLRQARQVSKGYLVLRVLEEYHKQHHKYPGHTASRTENDQLLEARNEVFEQLHIDNELLGDEFTSNCSGAFYPVSAVVGGVMSQEVIKAVSGKDAPHDNFFFYDGVLTTGMVHKITTEKEEKKSNAGAREEKQQDVEAVVL